MAAEEVVLTQTLTLLPSLAPAPLPPRLLEEFLNVLIDQFELFKVLVLNRRSHIHADLFNSWLLTTVWTGLLTRC